MITSLPTYERTVFPSAAYTASQDSGEITVPIGYRGVRIFINETAHASTPSTTFAIQVKDPASGVWTTLLVSAAITGEGMTVLTLYPGVPNVANVAQSGHVGRSIKIISTAGNSNSQTYSVGLQFLV
jgi:hypothetical protein